MWTDRGVDLHLVMHESLVPTVERMAGPGSARVVSPLVAATFLCAEDRHDARRALGLPVNDRLVVVSGGGWGVGDLKGLSEAALELPDVRVVCLAGREDAARERLIARLRGRAARDRARIHRSDERPARGRRHARSLDRRRHVPGGTRERLPDRRLRSPARSRAIARSRDGRTRARRARTLGRGAAGRSRPRERRMPPHRSPTNDDAADLVLAARARVGARKRSRAARPLALAAAATTLVVAVFSSDLTYPLVAEAFALPASGSIAKPDGAVALVVHGDRDSLLAFAPIARRHHLHGSVATGDPLTPGQVARLRASGLDPIPEIAKGGLRASFGAGRKLKSAGSRLQARTLLLLRGSDRRVHDRRLSARAPPRRHPPAGERRPGRR